MRDCAFFREVAAELALGVLTGPDRSAALAHMDRCARCQAEVASLAKAADRLLDLTPARDAPDCFESRVTAAFGQTLPEPAAERRQVRPLGGAVRAGGGGPVPSPPPWRQACWVSGCTGPSQPRNRPPTTTRS
jgi:hypothetical protein